MATAGRIARNSFFLFSSQGYTALIVLLYIPILTRYLGPEDYGRYNYAYAFVGLFQVLAFLGLHTILVREAARDKERAGLYFGNVLVVKLLLSLLTLGLLLLATWWQAPSAEERLIIYLAAAEMLIRIYGNANISVFRAFQRMEYEFAVDFVDATVALAGVLLVVYFQLGLVAVFAAFLVSGIARTLTGFALNLARFVKPRFQIDRGIWRRFLGESTPIGVSMGLQRVYERQGTVILQGIRGSTEVGFLGGPLRIYRLMDIGVQSVVGALFPMFSQLAVSDRERLRETYSTALKLLILLSLPLSSLLFVFAPEIVFIILGPDFGESVLALQILATAVVFSFLGFLFSFLLRAIDRQREDTANWFLALALNLGLSYFLISQYGFAGAGLALAISEGVFAVVGLLLVSRHLPTISPKDTWFKPLACGFAAIIVLLALRGLSPLAALLASGLVYLISIIILDVLNASEKRLLSDLAFSFASRLGWRSG